MVSCPAAPAGVQSYLNEGQSLQADFIFLPVTKVDSFINFFTAELMQSRSRKKASFTNYSSASKVRREGATSNAH
jgi:hypothetical protein